MTNRTPTGSLQKKKVRKKLFSVSNVKLKCVGCHSFDISKKTVHYEIDYYFYWFIDGAALMF